MAKFNEYTQKATPEDADTLMIYDTAAKANKLSPFSGIWNWIVEKLTNAVISNLQTSNKSVIGALNELNSKPLMTESTDLNNASGGFTILHWKLQTANTPRTEGLTTASSEIVLSYIESANWAVQFGMIPADKKWYVRVKSNGEWSRWEEKSSNRLFDIYRNYSWKTSHSIDVSKASTLLMIAFGGSNGDQSIVLPLTKTKTDTWLYNAEYLATTNFAISCKSNVLTITNTATFLCFLVKVI